MGENEEQALLSTLGIKSSNVEDLERKILSDVNGELNNELRSDLEASPRTNEQSKRLEVNEASTSEAKLYSKLHEIELQIDAVASSIERPKPGAQNEQEGVPTTKDKKGKGVKRSIHLSADGVLQNALAVERLRSLKKSKAQVEKEISRIRGHKRENDDIPERNVERRPNNNRTAPSVGKSIGSSGHSTKVVSYVEDDEFDAVLDAASGGFMETKREVLVRKGLLTPFHKLEGFERRFQHSGASTSQEIPKGENLEEASFARVAKSFADIAMARPTSKLLDADELPGLEPPARPFQRLGTPLKHPLSPETKGANKKANGVKIRRPLPDKKWRSADKKKKDLNDDDDSTGDQLTSGHEEESAVADDNCNDENAIFLEGGLKIPRDIYEQLFDYQKVGVQWMWELHCQRAGGIIGDEMGLGKTIQVIAFLGALHFSKLYKPSIVVCPVTLLRQWKREVDKWYPGIEVEILHDSADGLNKRKRTSHESESDSEGSWDNELEEPVHARPRRKWDDLISHVANSESGLLLTTYEQVRLLGEKLLDVEWGYAILDEGHRIRNPNAEITLVCKQFQTVHRVIMTGAPIQNKLAELWSLFDFVFPGKLGVLPVFEAEFAVPITIGGYANATPLQVSTAYRCAVILRDLIMPYLLRRMKADVNVQLPKKTEQVLFCSLTPEQRSIYRAFLASSEVEEIFDGRRNSLYGIDVLRKICNHPDLLEREHSANHPDYGNPERSGKMKVVEQVLSVWREQGHRVLLFCQTQQMLNIIESFLTAREYNYRRMDGLTPVKQRMALMDEFNNSSEVFIFILTTKVGGLGTNLTGADRVVIYDPDWNPSTDMQARERAWRIGQKRDVTVYRLITRGTIEEKVYHRQIYKHFLTNKVLKNPQQRRFFKARDMKDLFTLQDEDGGSTETSNIFGQLADELKVTTGVTDESMAQHQVEGLPSSSRFDREVIDDKSKDEMEEETDILKSLLEAQGIHSAVNHDAIISANDDQKLKMEERASQVAQRAAEALRKSRMLRSRDSFTVPTWTGRAGAAGAPSSIQRRFGGMVNPQLAGSSRTSGASGARGLGISAGTSGSRAMSSAELLSRIHGTWERASEDALEHDWDSASTLSNRSVLRANRRTVAQPEVLVRQLCTFIQQRGGRADSVSITERFKDSVESKDVLLFKNLLKEIARLERSPSGSEWVLKAEYQ